MISPLTIQPSPPHDERLLSEDEFQKLNLALFNGAQTPSDMPQPTWWWSSCSTLPSEQPMEPYGLFLQLPADVRVVRVRGQNLRIHVWCGESGSLRLQSPSLHQYGRDQIMLAAGYNILATIEDPGDRHSRLERADLEGLTDHFLTLIELPAGMEVNMMPKFTGIIIAQQRLRDEVFSTHQLGRGYYRLLDPL